MLLGSHSMYPTVTVIGLPISRAAVELNRSPLLCRHDLQPEPTAAPIKMDDKKSDIGLLGGAVSIDNSDAASVISNISLAEQVCAISFEPVLVDTFMPGRVVQGCLKAHVDVLREGGFV